MDIVSKKITEPEVKLQTIESFLMKEKIEIYCYPLEIILAEKILAVYSWVIKNNGYTSRVKDLWDIKILNELYAKQIDYQFLIQACNNVFKERNTEFNFDKLKQIGDIIFDKNNKNQQNIIEKWALMKNFKNLKVDDLKTGWKQMLLQIQKVLDKIKNSF